NYIYYHVSCCIKLSIMIMRCRNNRFYTLLHSLQSHCDTITFSLCHIIDARQNMTMNINHLHPPFLSDIYVLPEFNVTVQSTKTESIDNQSRAPFLLK